MYSLTTLGYPENCGTQEPFIYSTYCRTAPVGLAVHPFATARKTEDSSAASVVCASYCRESAGSSFTMYCLTSLGYPEDCGTGPSIYSAYCGTAPLGLAVHPFATNRTTKDSSAVSALP